MLVAIGGVFICVGLLWYFSGWQFGGTVSTNSASQALDVHATITQLIAQTANEKARGFLREAGKAFYDE